MQLHKKLKVGTHWFSFFNFCLVGGQFQTILQFLNVFTFFNCLAIGLCAIHIKKPFPFEENGIDRSWRPRSIDLPLIMSIDVLKTFN